jgi:hypothetical protein
MVNSELLAAIPAGRHLIRAFCAVLGLAQVGADAIAAILVEGVAGNPGAAAAKERILHRIDANAVTGDLVLGALAVAGQGVRDLPDHRARRTHHVAEASHRVKLCASTARIPTDAAAVNPTR